MKYTDNSPNFRYLMHFSNRIKDRVPYVDYLHYMVKTLIKKIHTFLKYDFMYYTERKEQS